MEQSARVHARQRLGDGQGSVRRAREWVEAGTLPERRRMNTNNSFVNQSTVQRQTVQRQIPKPAAVSSCPIPTAQPTAAYAPQWPLGSKDGSTERVDEVGSAPQRPPRPIYVPSILDDSRRQEHIIRPERRQKQQLLQSSGSQPEQPQMNDWERHYQTPMGQESGTPGTLGTGLTGSSSSRPSTSSSAGSIPDFPVPAIPQQLRRPPNLGPPPSSRRGASSYYSQSSYVTPIPEEQTESLRTTDGNHDSFASSHAIPTESWVDGPPGYYMPGYDDEEDMRDGEDGRDSRGTDHDETVDLVRKASLGQRHKSSLTMIRSNESLDKATGRAQDSVNVKEVEMSRPSLVSRVAVATGVTGSTFSIGPKNSIDEDQGSGISGMTVFLDPPSSGDSTSKSSTALGNIRLTTAANRETTLPYEDPRIREILGGLEKGGAIKSGTPSPVTSSPAGELASPAKRPPRLNTDALKEADARGSLTSLPDLIRRATRLASNLDRGRTASRLGMLEMFNGGEGGEKGLSSSNGKHRSGSLSDMLASFPPPGLHTHTPTPTGDRPGSRSRWPSPFANSNANINLPGSLHSKSKHSKPRDGRRCCGMPFWAFILLLIVLAILIAAAIVVPVTLIVLPRQNAANSATAGDLSNCSNSNPCGNGGTSVVASNSCRCVCVNGFTGTNCGQVADSGCTTVNIGPTAQSTSNYTNATLGSSIPRLLSAASMNFSIPLNTTVVLSLFSAKNLTCNQENTLVSFNNQQQRRNVQIPEVNPKKAIKPAITAIHPRDAIPTQDVVTTNGIVLASNTNAAASSLAVTTTIVSFHTPSPTASACTLVSVSTSVSPSFCSSFPPSKQPISQKDFDFARIAVLFVLQDTGIDAAWQAQVQLQNVLIGTTFIPGPVEIGSSGSSITADFSTDTIRLASGAVVGQRNSSNPKA